MFDFEDALMDGFVVVVVVVAAAVAVVAAAVADGQVNKRCHDNYHH